MSQNFLKFKRRLSNIRIARSVFVGVSCGFVAAFVWLILTKLAVIEFEPIYSIPIGLGAALLTCGAVFLLSRKSDMALAIELDSKFGLKARTQTMIFYEKEDGALFSMQRQDAEEALADVPTEAYKFNGLWVYITALALSFALLIGGIFVPDMRYYVPPEEVEAFELSDMQRTGINKLIKDVEESDMEEEFRTPIAEELRRLLSALEDITTVPDMRAELALSMAVICDITYESSTATEMLNAIWDSEDLYLRHLAVALDTSSWNSPDWGDFSEGISEFSTVLMGDTNEEEGALVGAASLKWALDSMTRKIDYVLDSSGFDESDEIYAAIYRLFNGNPGGFIQLLASIENCDDIAARKALDESMTFNGRTLYDAIALNRVNAITGEYAMTRLSGLFGVPMPQFERPDFVRKGLLPDGSQGSGNDKENTGGNTDGGLGTGAAYGSDDIVLDPITGEPTTLSKLIDKYNAIMNERLEGNFYTEEQKAAIRKYFDLLYMGVKKEEGK